MLLAVFCCGAVAQNCPPNMQQCSTKPPYNGVTITTDNTYRYINTSTCPPYDNPDWTNPAQACLRQTIFKIPLKPKRAKEPIPVGEKDSVYNGITYLKENPKPIMGALGVLLNGSRYSELVLHVDSAPSVPIKTPMPLQSMWMQLWQRGIQQTSVEAMQILIITTMSILALGSIQQANVKNVDFLQTYLANILSFLGGFLMAMECMVAILWEVLFQPTWIPVKATLMRLMENLSTTTTFLMASHGRSAA